MQMPEGRFSLALFYHYSHTRCEVLEPRLGTRRHAGEDPNAINEPVVWLNNRELNCLEGGDGILEFLHIVEVDESDPNLHLEKGFNDFMRDFEQDFELKDSTPWRWYFYKGTLPVKEVRTWNGVKYA